MPLTSGKYACLHCAGSQFSVTSTSWTCLSCNEAYGTFRGIPKLYLPSKIGEQDSKLRDLFYDGLFGRLYAFLMPFIVLPVRPVRDALRHWAIYGATILMILALMVALIASLLAHRDPALPLLLAAILLTMGTFLLKQPYLLHLLLLAVPTRLSITRSGFTPEETFAEVHARVLAPLRGSPEKLRVLDISTGSCNSLYKHGWMELNAEYTAIDLSTMMLSNGLDLMSERKIPVDLVVADALNLPFQSETFDIVLNYGAINGMTDPGRALFEMVRVAKPGALLLLLDEQMYESAAPVEKEYFSKVLSSHNLIHHCPVELMPNELEDVIVRQIYEFYYICTARKKRV